MKKRAKKDPSPGEGKEFLEAMAVPSSNAMYRMVDFFVHHNWIVVPVLSGFGYLYGWYKWDEGSSNSGALGGGVLGASVGLIIFLEFALSATSLQRGISFVGRTAAGAAAAYWVGHLWALSTNEHALITGAGLIFGLLGTGWIRHWMP